MMKIGFEKASCRVEMDYLLSGSVLKGTVQSKCTETRTFFKVESTADPEKIAKVIRLAKQGCFAENMIKEAVPLRSEIELNGEKMDFEG